MRPAHPRETTMGGNLGNSEVGENHRQGNSRIYMLARLDRDHPEKGTPKGGGRVQNAHLPTLAERPERFLC
jgi:hypothetical protein